MTEEDVREYSIPRIARYKVPKRVFFVDEFPHDSFHEDSEVQASRHGGAAARGAQPGLVLFGPGRLLWSCGESKIERGRRRYAAFLCPSFLIPLAGDSSLKAPESEGFGSASADS